MGDIIDKANERAEQLNELARSQRKPTGPVPNGICHFCGEPIEHGGRFCDIDCRDDWQHEQDMKHRNGGAG